MLSLFILDCRLNRSVIILPLIVAVILAVSIVLLVLKASFMNSSVLCVLLDSSRLDNYIRVGSVRTFATIRSKVYPRRFFVMRNSGFDLSG